MFIMRNFCVGAAFGSPPADDIRPCTEFFSQKIDKYALPVI